MRSLLTSAVLGILTVAAMGLSPATTQAQMRFWRQRSYDPGVVGYDYYGYRPMVFGYASPKAPLDYYVSPAPPFHYESAPIYFNPNASFNSTFYYPANTIYYYPAPATTTYYYPGNTIYYYPGYPR
jgi:hypothetical protein